MTAVVTLLSSIFIAIFFIGPAVTAKLLIELLVIKQPSRTQSSTEELARSLLASLPALTLALFVVWLRYHARHGFDPDAVIRVFSDGTRDAALSELWPVRTVFCVLYAEVFFYVLLVWLAAKRIPHLRQGQHIQYSLFTKLTSPYLKSEWDVIASGLLLRNGTRVYADVATKSQKIYMGQLAGVKTASDGSLVHVQLSEPSIRGQEQMAAGGLIARGPTYVFRNSVYFIIPAAEIANVNLRFLATVPTPATSHASPPSAPPTSGAAADDPQSILEISLEDTLQQLDETTRRSLRAELGPSEDAFGEDG